MSKPKHFPGPWRVSENNAGIKGSNWIFDSKGRDVAVVKLHTFASALANARLIAAAPELLDAALIARAILSRLGANDPEHKLRLEYLQIEEAIAKAKGSDE